MCSMACREYLLLACNVAFMQLDGCQTQHLANISSCKKTPKKTLNGPKNLLSNTLFFLLIFVMKKRKDTAENLSCVSKERQYMQKK